MTKFRRRLLMSAVSNSSIPDRSNLVTWEKLFSVIPKGVFVRRVNGEYNIFKDYGASSSYLTWGKLYKVIEPGIYFTVVNNEIQTNFDTSSGTPHLDAYVTYGDIRSIFPQGFAVATYGDNLYVTYDESLITDEGEDLNRLATPVDLFKIIPHGVEFFLIGGELVVRNLGLNNPNAVDLGDLSKCDDLPNIHYGANPNTYPSLRNLFQIIPSNVMVHNGQLIPNDFVYDDSPLTIDDISLMFDLSCRIEVVNDKPVVVKDDSIESELNDIISWEDIWKIIPNGVTVSQLSSGEYYFKYDPADKLSVSASTIVTPRELSKVIPFGVATSYNESDGSVEIFEFLDHVIWYNRFDNPFTDDVLQSIMNGYKIKVNDYTGQAVITQ